MGAVLKNNGLGTAGMDARPLWLLLALAALLGACDECKTSADCDLGQVCVDGACEAAAATDADTDGDTDADSDGDTDADGDTDTDADADSDSDSDTDADADSDSDADTDTDTDADCVDPLTDCPDDGNPCTAAACEDGDCVVVLLSDVPCDGDTDECIGGTCDDGVCVDEPLTGVPCTFDDNDCTQDVCDDGVCTGLPLNAVPCSFDGTLCTEDVCVAGTCTGVANQVGEPCESDGNSCTNDVCDSDGACDHQDYGYGFPCADEGNECTSDYCDGDGTCIHDPLAWGFACTDDGGECTNDYCDGEGACTHPNVGSSVACTPDGNVCTNDFCDGEGSCGIPLSAIACASDDNECTNDSCDVGVCDHQPLTGQACTPDGNDCTQDICNAGTCGLALNGAPCAYDDNVCTEDVCDGAVCTGPAKQDGTACEDASWCNGQEQCQDGECLYVEGTNPCEQLEPCKEGLCDEPAGGETEGQCDIALLDGVSCEDGDWCNGPDACVVGVCLSGPGPCNEVLPGPCEQVVCNGAAQTCDVDDAEDGTPCADSVLCDGTEICEGGECVAGVPFCENFNDCLWYDCYEDTDGAWCDEASPHLAANGTPCGSDNLCTGGGNHQCLDGSCAYGSSPPCALWADENFCTSYLTCEPDGFGGVDCLFEITQFNGGVLGCTENNYHVFDTSTSQNELSSYLGAECQGNFTGGELVYRVDIPQGTSYHVSIQTNSSIDGDNLKLLLVSDACQPANTCVDQSSTTVENYERIDRVAPSSPEFVIIDGLDGNRGTGIIGVQCD